MSGQPTPPGRVLFAYPVRCAFGRAIAKTRIEQHAQPSKSVRAALTAEVARMVWQYKLAPDTLRLAAARGVAEIQVLHIELKPGVADVSQDVLRCIDKAIAHPLIFEVSAGQGIKTIAAPKRPSQADSAQWVTGDYFAGTWANPDAPRQPLPVALDLSALYAELLRAFMPWPAREGETIHAQAERLARIRTLERERDQITTRMNRERQFNRRVSLNHQRKACQADIDALTAYKPVPNPIESHG